MRLHWLILVPAMAILSPTESWAEPTQKVSADEIVVIVHRDSPIRKLSSGQLHAIFTTRMRNVSKTRVVPLNLPPRHKLRVAFDRAALGMNPKQVGRFWIDRRVRGGTRPPKQISKPGLVLRVVGKHKRAVGYVFARTLGPKNNVRIVARIGGGKITTP